MEGKKGKTPSGGRKAPMTVPQTGNTVEAATFPVHPPFWPESLAVYNPTDPYTQAFERDTLPYSGGSWLHDVDYDVEDDVAAAFMRDARHGSIGAGEYATTMKWAENGSHRDGPGHRSATPTGSPPETSPIEGAGGTIGAMSNESLGDSKTCVGLPKPEIYVPVMSEQVSVELFCSSIARQIVDAGSELYVSRCFDRIKSYYSACATWDSVKQTVSSAFLPLDDLARGATGNADKWAMTNSFRGMSYRQPNPCDSGIKPSFLLTASEQVTKSLASRNVIAARRRVPAEHLDPGAPAIPPPIDEHCRFVVDVVPSGSLAPPAKEHSSPVAARPSRTLRPSVAPGANAAAGGTSGAGAAHSGRDAKSTSAASRGAASATPPLGASASVMPGRRRPARSGKSPATSRSGNVSVSISTQGAHHVTGDHIGEVQLEALTVALAASTYRAPVKPEGTNTSRAATSPRAPRRPGLVVSIDGAAPVRQGNVVRDRQRNLARTRRGPSTLQPITAAPPAEEVAAAAGATLPPLARVGGDQPTASRRSRNRITAGGRSPKRRQPKLTQGPTESEKAYVAVAAPPDPEFDATGTMAPVEHATSVAVIPAAGVAVLNPLPPGGAVPVRRGGPPGRRGEPIVIADGGPFPIPQGKECWPSTNEAATTSRRQQAPHKLQDGQAGKVSPAPTSLAVTR